MSTLCRTPGSMLSMHCRRRSSRVWMVFASNAATGGTAEWPMRSCHFWLKVGTLRATSCNDVALIG